jgi:hypothetical protein
MARSIECGPAEFAGRCGFCFQRYSMGSVVRNHKTATRLLMHKECSTQELGSCVGCARPLDGEVVAVNYGEAQRGCVACAGRMNWKCAPGLRKFNRLADYFKKLS